MRKIFVFGAILATLVFLTNLTPLNAFATVTEPDLVIFGNVKKNIIDLSDVYEYKDDGNIKTVDYTTYKNITFNSWDIGFETAFENATLTGCVEDEPKWNGTASFLKDSNEISYLLLKAVNNTVLGTNTWYYGACMVTNTLDKELSNNYYVLAGLYGDVLVGDGTLASRLAFHFYDEYLNEYVLYLYYNALEKKVSWGILGPSGYLSCPMPENDLFTSVDKLLFQLKLQDLLDRCSSSVQFRKVFKVVYWIQLFTNSTLQDNYELAGTFRSGFFSCCEVNIDDIAINATALSIPETNALQTTRNITLIADATIPFKFSTEYDIEYDDENNEITYDYEFLLPSATALGFSGAKGNYTVPSGEIKALTVNAVDYKSKVQNKDPGDVVVLLTSVSVGTNYKVSTEVQYTDDEYYEIAMAIGIAWYTPAGLFDKLLAFLLAIVNLLGGVGASRIKSVRASIRTPKTE